MKTTAIVFLGILVSLVAFAQSGPTAQERQLVNQLNQSRREAGLPPLQVDPKLTQAAREHSQLMSARNQLGHVLEGEPSVANRLAATGLRFNRSGENVGYNTDFNGLHSGWMNSPPHRENILDPRFTLVGIGVVKGDDGVFWATQDFAHGIAQVPADQAEDLAAQSFEKLRSRTGAPELKREDSATLQKLACEMGNSGQLDPKQVLALPGVHYAITYNNSLPEELPNSARKLAGEKKLTKYAVGACFVNERNNVGGTYYVLMAFY